MLSASLNKLIDYFGATVAVTLTEHLGKRRMNKLMFTATSAQNKSAMQ